MATYLLSFVFMLIRPTGLILVKMVICPLHRGYKGLLALKQRILNLIAIMKEVYNSCEK